MSSEGDAGQFVDKTVLDAEKGERQEADLIEVF